MASIQNVTAAASSATTAAAAGGPAAGSSSTDIQDRFLKLLVTQLKNQDPLNPMDNAQLTSQESRIATLENDLLTANANLHTSETRVTQLEQQFALNNMRVPAVPNSARPFASPQSTAFTVSTQTSAWLPLVSDVANTEPRSEAQFLQLEEEVRELTTAFTLAIERSPTAHGTFIAQLRDRTRKDAETLYFTVGS